VNRLHLLLGISGYLAGPLWLAFLLMFNWIHWYQKYTGLSEITVHGYLTDLSGTAHALLVFVICIAILFLPKALALIDLAFDWDRRRAFGGLARTTVGVVIETIFSTLHAPLLMLWHTRFVAMNLLGISVGWSRQRRETDSTTWRYAVRRHWGHTLIGLVWGVFMWQLNPDLFWWFTPVFAGMVLSIPLSVLTSRASLGARARKMGLLLTPEEIKPPIELVSLRSQMKIHEITDDTTPRRAHAGLAEAVLDPYVNAIHVSLLREKRFNPVYAEQLAKLGVGHVGVQVLGEKLLAEGPAQLTRPERLLLMTDAHAMVWLHQQSWLRPGESLAPWWRSAIQEYSRRD